MRLINVAAAFVLFLVSACSNTQNMSKFASFTPPPGRFVVAIMKPDVEVALLTAGGLTETNAAWSEAATSNLLEALTSQLGQSGGSVLVPSKSPQEPATALQIADLERLHRAVGTTIFQHGGDSAFSLPTKKKRFDWSLGSDARDVGAKIGADYALFLYARDSFSSGGRVVMQVLLAGVGVGVPGGSQISFVSLVDLKTGNVVWFNVLAKQTGDLRKADGAGSSVAELIKGMPVTPLSSAAK